MISTLLLALASLASAHTGAFAPGMYCRGGPTDIDDNNTNTVVNPLGDLTKSDWWFQHDRGCDAKPPPAGEFLELPAGKDFTVEIAHNRAFTTLSYDGRFATDWPDGQNHPEDYAELTPGACVTDGALHTNNQSTAAGTAWAISYESDLSKVTLENLVVFSVLEHTPWKRLATYEVPAGLPACPPEGCTCAWLWVPLLCGISNMYMQGFKCNVTGATSAVPLAEAKAAVWCEGDPSKCTKGAKQMIAWNQKDGNNIVTNFPVAPGYNMKLGWKSGAQNDIFAEEVLPSSPATSIKPMTASDQPVVPSSTILAITPIKPATLSINSSTIGTIQPETSKTTTVTKTTIKTTTRVKTTAARTTRRAKPTTTKKTKTTMRTTTTVEDLDCAEPTVEIVRRHRHGVARYHV